MEQNVITLIVYIVMLAIAWKMAKQRGRDNIKTLILAIILPLAAIIYLMMVGYTDKAAIGSKPSEAKTFSQLYNESRNNKHQ